MESTQHSGNTAVAEKIEIKEPSQYNVIVYNNDNTSYEEVIYVVSKTFELSEKEAYDIALKVDTIGQGVCGTYSKEIAEAKLALTELVKDSLISLAPRRQEHIKELKFTMEKV